MGSLGEETPSAPIVLSRTTGVFRPDSDILTYAFEGKEIYQQDAKLYIDAENPSVGLTASQVKITTRKIIAGFQAAGIQVEDCVNVHLPNHFFYSCLFFGIVGAGARFAGSNPYSTSYELAHRFRSITPKAVVTTQAHLQDVIQALQKVGHSQTIIYIFDYENCVQFVQLSGESEQNSVHTPNFNNELSCDFKGRVYYFSELLQHGEADWLRLTGYEASRETIAALYSTSGTTGPPKFAELSHSALISRGRAIASPRPYKPKRLSCLPMFNIFGALIVHIDPIHTGVPVYIFQRFHLETYAQAIESYGITDTPLPPLLVSRYVQASASTRNMLASLRYVWVSGNPVSTVILRSFRTLLHPTALIAPLYGLTENGPVTLFNWLDARDDTGSVGRAAPDAEIQLRHPKTGEIICEEEAVGEAWTRNDGVMTGYHRNPKATTETFQWGWMRTGDAVYVKGGKYYVVDRLKELIKVHGFQVSPAELEGLLLEHPQVAEAAVARVIMPGKDSEDNEAPRAFVVKKEGATVTEGEIKKYIEERVVKYKWLEGGLVFLDEIPKTSSSKNDRKRLVELYPL